MPAVVWSDNHRVDGGAKTGVGYARQVGGLSAFSPTVTSAPRTAPRRVPAARSGGTAAPSGQAAAPGRLPATGLPASVPLLALAGIGLALLLRRRAA
jgi:LPXTG-motif cell wall-anchored protein